MKEKATDGFQTGGKAADNGWHYTVIGEGMEHVKNKEGVEWQDEKGHKAWRIPMTVKDDNDPSNGAYIDCSVFESNGGEFMASILQAVGMWGAICKANPGDDVSVFDSQIIEKVRAKIGNLPLMVRSEQDKEGRPKVRQVASFDKYKEIIEEEKRKKGAGGAKAQGQVAGEKPATEAQAAATGDDW